MKMTGSLDVDEFIAVYAFLTATIEVYEETPPEKIPKEKAETILSGLKKLHGSMKEAVDAL